VFFLPPFFSLLNGTGCNLLPDATRIVFQLMDNVTYSLYIFWIVCSIRPHYSEHYLRYLSDSKVKQHCTIHIVQCVRCLQREYVYVARDDCFKCVSLH
jgi:hypothetical protein